AIDPIAAVMVLIAPMNTRLGIILQRYRLKKTAKYVKALKIHAVAR
ncbi:unnamed protein product, partial [marine sediment metagenome]